MAALGVGLVGCGSGTESAGTPGFRDGTTTTDPGPFQMAAPGSTGSTTLPEGEVETGTGPTPTTPPPTTTTTLPPPPSVPEGDPMCGALLDIAEIYRRAGPLEADIDQLRAMIAERFRSAALQFEAAGAAGVAGLEDLVVVLRTQADEIGEASTVEEAYEIASPVLEVRDPVVQAASADVIEPHLRGACPELARQD